MAKWGLPEWENVDSYGNPEEWSLSRWRWEFVRRHEVYREAFLRIAKRSYREAMKDWRLYGSEGDTPLKPGDPDFVANASSSENEFEYGFRGLPNPRISEQPDLRIRTFNTDWRARTINYDDACDACYREEYLDVDSFMPSGTIAIRFNLTMPISPQIDGLTDELLRQQQFFYGGIKNQLSRIRKDKWLCYLRVLDGKACGATLDNLTCCLDASLGNKSPQAARNTLQQAEILRNKMIFFHQF